MINTHIALEHATLGFTKTGTGEKTLLMFHGFGQTRDVFNPLAEALSDQYTVYAFDLFFHGKSEWTKDEQPLEKAFWTRLITGFLQEHAIEKFSVLGFSMGGKFALATLEVFPERVEEIFLLAPDGIKTSMWYSLATDPVAFRNLFKSMIRKPGRFQSIANLAFRVKLIDKGILRFVESQMNTEEKRKRVYASWVVFRHLKFDMKHIASLINQHSIRLVLIVGKYDRIITAKNMARLTRHVSKFQLEIPETGHNSIIGAGIRILKNLKR